MVRLLLRIPIDPGLQMSRHIQNNQIAQKAIGEFLKKIHYHRQTDILAALDGTIVDIFMAAGQKNLLYLIKLRRYWLEQSDEFLARHAYPQRISAIWDLKITSQYLETLKEESSLSPSFHEILKNHENAYFTPSHFFKFLCQRLKRKVTPEEKKLLLAPANFTLRETILHLVVYDGAFIQAIQFEMPSYLKQINHLLANFQIDRIQCQVGDLGQKHQDQIWIGALSSVWETLLSPEFAGHCIPAFVRRSSYYGATLMIYVSNPAVRALLNTPMHSRKLLDSIYHIFPEIQFVIQKVGFIVQRGMNPEQVRTSSVLMAESANDPISIYERLKQLIQQNDSPSALPKKEGIPSLALKKQRRPLSPLESIDAVRHIIQRIKKNQAQQQS